MMQSASCFLTNYLLSSADEASNRPHCSEDQAVHLLVKQTQSVIVAEANIVERRLHMHTVVHKWNNEEEDITTRLRALRRNTDKLQEHYKVVQSENKTAFTHLQALVTVDLNNRKT